MKLVLFILLLMLACLLSVLGFYEHKMLVAMGGAVLLGISLQQLVKVGEAE